MIHIDMKSLWWLWIWLNSCFSNRIQYQTHNIKTLKQSKYIPVFSNIVCLLWQQMWLNKERNDLNCSLKQDKSQKNSFSHASKEKWMKGDHHVQTHWPISSMQTPFQQQFFSMYYLKTKVWYWLCLTCDENIREVSLSILSTIHLVRKPSLVHLTITI